MLWSRTCGEFRKSNNINEKDSYLPVLPSVGMIC